MYGYLPREVYGHCRGDMATLIHYGNFLHLCTHNLLTYIEHVMRQKSQITHVFIIFLEPFSTMLVAHPDIDQVLLSEPL